MLCTWPVGYQGQHNHYIVCIVCVYTCLVAILDFNLFCYLFDFQFHLYYHATSKEGCGYSCKKGINLWGVPSSFCEGPYGNESRKRVPKRFSGYRRQQLERELEERKIAKLEAWKTVVFEDTDILTNYKPYLTKVRPYLQKNNVYVLLQMA